MYSNDVSKLQSAGHMKIIGQKLTIKNMKCQIHWMSPTYDWTGNLIWDPLYVHNTDVFFRASMCNV